MYFKNSRDVEQIQESFFQMLKSETENAENSSHEFDNFWDTFDGTASSQMPGHVSIESEIHMWKGVSRPHRTANPIHAMEGLKRDYPRIYKLFRKYSIFPATQNKSERLFSMVGRNTGPQNRLRPLKRKLLLAQQSKNTGSSSITMMLAKMS